VSDADLVYLTLTDEGIICNSQQKGKKTFEETVRWKNNDDYVYLRKSPIKICSDCKRLLYGLSKSHIVYLAFENKMCFVNKESETIISLLYEVKK
jgi:hypothetical protein